MLPGIVKSWRAPILQIPIKAFKDGLQWAPKDNILTNFQRYFNSDLQVGAVPSSRAVSVQSSNRDNLRAPEYVYFWEKLKKCFGFGKKKSKSGKKMKKQRKEKCSQKKDTCLKKKESNPCEAKPVEKLKPDCKPKEDNKKSKVDVAKKDEKKDVKKSDSCKKEEEKKSDKNKKEIERPDPCKKGDEKKDDPCKKKDENKPDPSETKVDPSKNKEDPCKKKDDPCKKKDDPCKKKDDPCKKKDDPCKKKDDSSKTINDPCKKKEDPIKKKDDPCKKKEDPCKNKVDPCKKKEDPCKKKEDPCKNKDDSGKKKEDPCKKKEDPCKRKEDPCKKEEDPCKKKDDPCKKKDDPCKKKDDPCKKKEDPCKKKEDPCKKKEDPCKKKEDPCKKEDDPCKKKDPSGDKCTSNESLAMDPILLFSLSQPTHKKQEETKETCRDPCAQGACDALPGQDEPCGSSVSWKVKVNPCRQKRSSGKNKCSSSTACIVDTDEKKVDEKLVRDSGCGLTAFPCGKKLCPNRCELKKKTKFSSLDELWDVTKFDFMNVGAGRAEDNKPSSEMNFASKWGKPVNPTPSRPPSRSQVLTPGSELVPGAVAQKVSGIVGKIKDLWNGPEQVNPEKDKQQPISTPMRPPSQYPRKQRCEGLNQKSCNHHNTELPELPTNNGFVFAVGPPQDDFEKCEDMKPPCPVEIESLPCPKKIETCDVPTDETWSDIDESYGYERFPFKREQNQGTPIESASLKSDDPYANHRL